jgi:hypothetical protein
MAAGSLRGSATIASSKPRARRFFTIRALRISHYSVGDSDTLPRWQSRVEICLGDFPPRLWLNEALPEIETASREPFCSSDADVQDKAKCSIDVRDSQWGGFRG